MATKSRKIPHRTCVACRETFPKKELFRVVRTPEGRVEVDPSGKKSGRGASVCSRPSCLDGALKSGVLARSLQVSLDRNQIERIRAELHEVAGVSGSDE